MRYRSRCLALAMAIGPAAVLAAPAEPPRVMACDTTLAPQPLLRVQDEASAHGAIVKDVRLITLPNGMPSVQFSIRHARELNPFGTILKVRYTVQWTDDCGRQITNGGQTVDGLALDPHRQRILQSTAMDPYATHAILRVYVEN